MNDGLSVVTPCYDDLENLGMTLDSLRNELGPDDELIVVDSSKARDEVHQMVLNGRLACEVNYVWMKPEGVYQAQNAGIRRATKGWVEIINAGDRMCSEGRRQIREAVHAHRAIEIHVFRGGAFLKGGLSYAFTPTPDTFWPHQSIVVRRTVYETAGAYDEQYKYAADQIYFAQARKRHSWMIHPQMVAEFLLGGRSSGITLRHLRENYAARRAMGTGVGRAIVSGVVTPVFRYVLERTIGSERVLKLKCLVFGYYRLENMQRKRLGTDVRR